MKVVSGVVLTNEQNEQNEQNKNTAESVSTDDAPKNVPPSNLYGHNLKKMKSYKKLRRGYKLSNQKAIFLGDLNAILKEFKPDAHKYDDELLIEILDLAEKYFVYGSKEDRENVKSECVLELMKPFFNNDENLIEKTISNVWHRVDKSNGMRRAFIRLKNFFCLNTRN